MDPCSGNVVATGDSGGECTVGPSSEEEHTLLLDRGLTQPQKVKAQHEHTSIKMLRDEERGYSLGRKRSYV